METTISASKENLADALQVIGRDVQLRTKFIELLKEVESTLSYPIGSVRENVTGPVANAMYEYGELERRELRSGLNVEFRYTSKIARDFVLSRDTYPDHVWEPQTTKLLLHLSENVRHVIVGGAYFGDQVLLIADHLKAKGGFCHAFEPNAQNFAMLLKNTAANALPNVCAHEMGLWYQDDVELCFDGDDAYASSCELDGIDDRRIDTFRTITIDSYVRANEIDAQVGLVMIDAEGAELNALRGAQSLLSKPSSLAPNLVFEIHRNYVDWSVGLENTEIVSFLIGLGYALYAVRDYHSNCAMEGKPIELIPLDKTYLEGPPHGFNVLATKDFRLINDDIFKMCEHVSPKLLLHRDPALHHPLH